MVSLTDLPNEILDNIISHLLHQYLRHSHPRNCLIDLSLVSRRLNHVTNAILYQSVYYRSENDEAPAGPGEASLEAPYIPPTRIFHLGYFSRTLECSLALRALILHVDISWSKSLMEVFVREQIIHALRLLASSTRSVHLEPPDSSFVVPSFLSLTSLSLTYEESSPFVDVAPLVSLHKICLIPTLRRLSLSHWPSWDLGPTTMESQSRSSGITHLSLYRSSYPGPLLKKVLAWPRALESFIFQSYPYEKLHFVELPPYSPKDLLDYLHPQQDTLQSIFLIINTNKYEALSIHSGDGSTLRDFSAFHNLKRLCISREVLGFPSGIGFPRLPFEIRVMLPPLLEQFQVDIQFSGDWGRLLNMDEKLNTPLAPGIFGVLECLQHIVMNKAADAPRLKRIVVYYGTNARERRLLSEDRAIPPRQSERAKLLERASTAAGVEAVFWTNWRRPLWEDWLSPDGLIGRRRGSPI